MTGETLEDRIFSQVEPIVAGSGMQLVDVRAQIVRDALRVHIVLFRDTGVGINDCAEIHRMVVPLLEAASPDRDLSIEVGSPGIERSIRLPREYRVFLGKGVRILSQSRAEWIGGIIDSCDENGVLVRSGDGSTFIQYSDIQKARLDDSQEV